MRRGHVSIDDPDVRPKTAELWAKHNRHPGDRHRLFAAVAAAVNADEVLYPGSYVDIAPSFVFGSVTYVDTDRRTPGFFGDTEGIAQIVADHDGVPDADIAFIHGDYTGDLNLPAGHFDLLISLYSGFISRHCAEHLKVGGTLVVNASHGDVAMASIDPQYELSAVVTHDSGEYAVNTADLDTYLIPKKPQAITVDGLLTAGREIPYTRSPFAYLFTRTD